MALNHITKTISMNPFLGNVNIQKNHSRIKQVMFYKIHILTHGLTGKGRQAFSQRNLYLLTGEKDKSLRPGCLPVLRQELPLKRSSKQRRAVALSPPIKYFL